MKKQAVIMGMPVTLEIVDRTATNEDCFEVFAYLNYIDNKFSTYKADSEISQINRGEVKPQNYSKDMKTILRFADETKKISGGYFDININGILDPSGIVKGYAIWQGAKILQKKGYKNFYVEVAGDIQVFGKNSEGENWKTGIQNPFNAKEIIKIVRLTNKGIATSGNYQRGVHIYDPVSNNPADKIASITVIGPNVYEADRFATAAFAMGEKGIDFIEKLKGFEGYMVKKNKLAVFTGGFKKFLN